MSIIQTTIPIHLTGIGEIPQGVKASFYANFLPREKGLICHTEWYINQSALDNGEPIFAIIDELKQKDNIAIDYSEFSNDDLLKLQEATLIVQKIFSKKINERVINEVTKKRLIGVTDQVDIEIIKKNTNLEYKNFTIID